MKNLLIILSLVILYTFTSSCQQKGDQAAADIEAINSYFDQISSTLNGGNVDGWISLFTDDVIKMQPNAESIEGKEAVLQWALSWFNNYNMEESHSIQDIKVSGDWAFAVLNMILKATPKGGGEMIEMNHKSIWILKHQLDGSWKCSYHIWNSNDPLPPAKGE